MRKSIITIVALFIGFSAATRAAEPDTAAANIALIRGQHESLNRGDWKAASRDFAVDALNFGHPAGGGSRYRAHPRRHLSHVPRFSSRHHGYMDER